MDGCVEGHRLREAATFKPTNGVLCSNATSYLTLRLTSLRQTAEK